MNSSDLIDMFLLFRLEAKTLRTYFFWPIFDFIKCKSKRRRRRRRRRQRNARHRYRWCLPHNPTFSVVEEKKRRLVHLTDGNDDEVEDGEILLHHLRKCYLKWRSFLSYLSIESSPAHSTQAYLMDWTHLYCCRCYCCCCFFFVFLNSALVWNFRYGRLF